MEDIRYTPLSEMTEKELYELHPMWVIQLAKENGLSIFTRTKRRSRVLGTNVRCNAGKRVQLSSTTLRDRLNILRIKLQSNKN